jgi:hypothetical protein
MKRLVLSAMLLAAPHLFGQTTSATTGKPNVFGETKTVIRDGSGRVTGTASTSKPNVFGEQKTVLRDASGRVTGTATTAKPNVFGEKTDPSHPVPASRLAPTRPGPFKSNFLVVLG